MLPVTLDVANLLTARTQPRLGGGEDTGDFTEHTVPNADAVDAWIEKAGRYVGIQLGDYSDIETANPGLYASILDVIALRAAADVERSYRPEQARGQGSLAEQLREQFAVDLKHVTQAVREYRSSGSIASGEGSLPLASGIEDDADIEVW